MTKKIYEVISVTISLSTILPPVLKIEAEGIVKSGGWTKGKLIPYVYTAPPTDGVYECDFVAEEPSGQVTYGIKTIKAETEIWENFPDDLKGIKVHGCCTYILKTI